VGTQTGVAWVLGFALVLAVQIRHASLSRIHTLTAGDLQQIQSMVAEKLVVIPK
jgi:hypothetical protein